MRHNLGSLYSSYETKKSKQTRADIRKACIYCNKKHFKNVGPIHHCEPPHANSPDVASGTVARRLRIDVHDDIDNDDNDNDNA